MGNKLPQKSKNVALNVKSLLDIYAQHKKAAKLVAYLMELILKPDAWFKKKIQNFCEVLTAEAAAAAVDEKDEEGTPLNSPA